MVRRIRHGASVGLIAWVAASSGGLAAAQVPPGPGTAIPVAVGSEATPGELQAWDARLDGMIRSGQLVVMSRTDDPTLADRTHEYAAQFVGGVPVLGAGVTRQFASGVTVSAFGTLHENLVLDTVPAITAGEAAVNLERQTGARLADGQTPELTVLPLPLPLPPGSYVLAYGAALDDGRYHFVSAADGRLVHSIEAFRSQSAIGTGLGILGDRKKVSTIFEGGRFETHDQLRPGEIVTLDAAFDIERRFRLLTPGPWGVQRWTPQDIADDDDNDWADTAVVDGHVHMGWTYDYFARRHGWEGLDGRRGAYHRHRQQCLLECGSLAPAIRARGARCVRVRRVPRARGAGWRSARVAACRRPRAHPRRRFLLGLPAYRVPVGPARRLPHRRVAKVRPAKLYRPPRRDPHLRYRDLSGPRLS